MLSIKDLCVNSIDNTKILRGISMDIQDGHVHIIVGPNGSGKSTLAKAIMGHPSYRVTAGFIMLKGEDITHAPTDQRARSGLFLSFQSPIEIQGVKYKDFLSLATNREVSDEELDKEARSLKIDKSLTHRSLNQDFSGGEKKKSEILQLSILKPKLAILDEPDSGLDIDALKVVAKAINNLSCPYGVILITHNQNILEYIKPDYVHVMKQGRIIKTGRIDLFREIQNHGYDRF